MGQSTGRTRASRAYTLEANLGAELTGSVILTSETIDKPLASDNLQLVMQASVNHKSTLTCLLPTPIGRVYIIGKVEKQY